MKKTEGFFRVSIKKAFAAFSYEHSGEMLSLQRKSQMLSESSVDLAIKTKDNDVLNKTTGS